MLNIHSSAAHFSNKDKSSLTHRFHKRIPEQPEKRPFLVDKVNYEHLNRKIIASVVFERTENANGYKESLFQALRDARFAEVDKLPRILDGKATFATIRLASRDAQVAFKDDSVNKFLQMDIFENKHVNAKFSKIDKFMLSDYVDHVLHTVYFQLLNNERRALVQEPIDIVKSKYIDPDLNHMKTLSSGTIFK